jgi:hypothetical protein
VKGTARLKQLIHCLLGCAWVKSWLVGIQGNLEAKLGHGPAKLGNMKPHPEFMA